MEGLVLRGGWGTCFPVTHRTLFSPPTHPFHAASPHFLPPPPQVSWALYSESSESATEALTALLTAVDVFTKHADEDLEVAEDVGVGFTLHWVTGGRAGSGSWGMSVGEDLAGAFHTVWDE